MTLLQLRYFQAVCNFQTVSDAAEYMHISQPSLSSAIRALENEFGVALFYRRHQGMQLTPAGERLREMSDSLLKHADRLQISMQELGVEKKTLRFGIPPMLGSLFLPRIYSEFLLQNTDIQLSILENGHHVLCNYLNEGHGDMALLSHDRTLERDLSSVLVAKMEIVCCVSKQHPLAGKKVIDFSELSDVALVLFKDSFFQTEELKRRFAKAGIEPNIVLQTDQLSTLKGILAGNAAAGFMFRANVQMDKDVVGIPLKEPIYASVSLAWSKGVPLTEPMERIKDYICLAFGGQV